MTISYTGDVANASGFGCFNKILIKWKDGSSTWEAMKYVKQCYPVQLAEYAKDHNISDQPAFAWWANYVLNKKKRIISKVQSKY